MSQEKESSYGTRRVREIASAVVLVGIVAYGAMSSDRTSEDNSDFSLTSSSSNLILDELIACTPFPSRFEDPSSLVYENEHTIATPISSKGDIFGPPAPTEIC